MERIDIEYLTEIDLDEIGALGEDGLAEHFREIARAASVRQLRFVLGEPWHPDEEDEEDGRDGLVDEYVRRQTAAALAVLRADLSPPEGLLE